MGQEINSINVGGFNLRYCVEGEGIPTIVIGTAVYYPRVFSTNLRKHLRLVFMDHRGCAPMPASPDPSSFELDTIIDDIEHARQELGLGKIAI